MEIQLLMSADANKEVSFLWTFISVFMVVWLSVDLFNSFFYGETSLLRHARYLAFNESPTFFVLTVIVKLLVYSYFCFYLYKRLVFYKKKFLKK